MLDRLRQDLVVDEFDYQLLMSYLKGYKKPLDKISRLLKSGDIIRIKKGLYVFGTKYRRGPICLEALANLVYGPSYVSLEYALSFHGLVPERITEITSITTQKNKLFKTPLGRFSYKHLHLKKYMVGVYQHHPDEHHYFLIAHKEKALADLLAKERQIANHEELFHFLTEDLRIEKEDLAAFNLLLLHEIAQLYKNQNIILLYELVKTQI